MVSIIAIGLNFVVMVGQVRFDYTAIPRQSLTMNLAGGGVVLILKMALTDLQNTYNQILFSLINNLSTRVGMTVK